MYTYLPLPLAVSYTYDGANVLRKLVLQVAVGENSNKLKCR